MVDPVRNWLEGLGLGEYAPVFSDNDVDMIVLPSLTGEDLKEIGISSVGHRRKLLEAIGSLRHEREVPRASGGAEDSPPKSRPIAERRQLTVMFCDLVGSTALSRQLDAEDLRDLILKYQDAVSEVTALYGGHIGKFLGDGVLVYFGWPQAYEDQAERSLRAGLEILRAVRELSSDQQKSLNARIGIATGQVVIGDMIGVSAQELDAVVGDTPNLAARLQGFARPGQLVIDAATRRLARAAFQLESLGSHSIKGFGEPVPAWGVVGAGTADSRFEAARAATTPFIGRQNELNLLLERWSLAKQNEAQVVLLSGEAGIGKSRLVAVLQDKIADDPHIRLNYQCTQLHANSALQPVIRQLERAAGFRPEDSVAVKYEKFEGMLRAEHSIAARSALAAMLSLPLERDLATLEMSAQQRKALTMQALIKELAALATHRPVLFVFEDAQWSDPSTEELLAQTVPLIADLPVLMLITHRPEWRPLWTERYGNVVSLSLGRLGRAQAMELVRAVIGGASQPSIVEEIAMRTDGIPLFVEEITKAVAEARAEALDGRPIIPESLQTSLLARLDRLGPAKEIAQQAAAIGREFSQQLLVEISALPPDILTAMLDDLVRAELIFRRDGTDGAKFQFKHALVRDVAYDSLLRSTRRKLHGRIAEALANTLGESGSAEPELVAHHFAEAGRAEQAVENWLLAGRRAAERSGNLEAIAHYGKGLELLTELPETPQRAATELRLRAGLGVPLSALRGPGSPEVLENYSRARHLCQQIGDPPEAYQVLWGLWRSKNAVAEMQEATKLASELLEIAGRTQESGLLLEAHHSNWTTFSRQHEPQRCWQHAERGIAIYDAEKHHRHVFTITDHDAGVCCRGYGALSLWQLGYAEQALKHSMDAVALARHLAHPTSLAHTLTHSCWLLLLRRDFEPALERAEEIVSVASQQRFAQYLATTDIFKGWLLVWIGQHEQGLKLLRQGLGSGQAKGTGPSNAYFRHLLADAYLQSGRIEEGLAEQAEASREVECLGTSAFQPEMYRVEGELRRLHPAFVNRDVEQSLEAAIQSARSRDARMLELRAATSLANHFRDIGEPTRARGLLAPIYEWFTEGFDMPDLIHAKALLDELAECRNGPD